MDEGTAMEEKFNMCRTVVVGRVDVRVTVSNSLWCQHTSRRLLICLIALRINILYYTYAGILYVTGTTAVSYSIYLIYLYFSTSSATVLMLTQTPSADEFASRAPATGASAASDSTFRFVPRVAQPG